MKDINYDMINSYGHHFNFIVTNMKKYFDIQLKPYDITSLQYAILVNLYKQNAKTQKELLNFVNGDEANITRLVTRLESKFLLKRVVDKSDKRKKQINLTKKGISLLEELMPLVKEANEELIKDLDEKESEELLRLLQKVKQTVCEAIDKNIIY